jgi:hypothetical protein
MYRVPGFVAADREHTDLVGREQAFLVSQQNTAGDDAEFFLAAT